MLQNHRLSYLKAMQIDVWVSRDSPIESTCLIENQTIIESPIETVTPSSRIKKPVINVTNNSQPAQPSIVASKEATQEVIPHFSLQLMQAGRCLLLVELPSTQPFQINDPAYQLLCNILKAAHLPNTPEWLGEMIRWPLFKQTAFPQAQGSKGANEFLQSLLTAYQAQKPDCHCLWLIGHAAIEFATGSNQFQYNQNINHDVLGNILLVPGLDFLSEQQSFKASLWKILRTLIPTWST